MSEEIFLQYIQLILTAKVIEINEANREFNEKTAELLQEILNQLKISNGKE